MKAEVPTLTILALNEKSAVEIEWVDPARADELQIGIARDECGRTQDAHQEQLEVAVLAGGRESFAVEIKRHARVFRAPRSRVSIKSFEPRQNGVVVDAVHR